MSLGTTPTSAQTAKERLLNLKPDERLLVDPAGEKSPEVIKVAEEYTGGSSSYYQIFISNPTTETNPPYLAECNDIIEALGMNYAEGSAFKAIWRKKAAELGKLKKGYDNGLYDSEKVEFFGARMVSQIKQAKKES